MSLITEGCFESSSPIQGWFFRPDQKSLIQDNSGSLTQKRCSLCISLSLGILSKALLRRGKLRLHDCLHQFELRIDHCTAEGQERLNAYEENHVVDATRWIQEKFFVGFIIHRCLLNNESLLVKPSHWRDNTGEATLSNYIWNYTDKLTIIYKCTLIYHTIQINNKK